MKLHPFDGRRNPVLTLLLMLLRVGLGALLVLWLVQEPLIFPGMLRGGDPAERAASAPAQGAREVVLQGDDGAEVVLWHTPASGTKAVVLFHGNGTLVRELAPLVATWHERGFDVVALEYRGFDGVPGWPTEAHLVADAHVAFAWVTRTLGVPADHVVLHGESLGGGVAAALAADVRPAGVVLISTFDSLRAVAAGRLWFLPVGPLVRSPFPSAERLTGVDVPAFVAHAADDGIVPFGRGETLARGLARATFVPVPTGAHGALTLTSPEVRAAWSAWVDALLP